MKIPALRIEINGEPVMTAGAEELASLIGTVGFGAGANKNITAADTMFLVMGLAVNCEQPRQLTWGNGTKLKLGDRVTFEVTEVEQPSAPDQVLCSPSPAQLAAASKRERQKTKN